MSGISKLNRDRPGEAVHGAVRALPLGWQFADGRAWCGPARPRLERGTSIIMGPQSRSLQACAACLPRWCLQLRMSEHDDAASA
eukprot:15099965-Alexandrium_andersonii.AAC.1